jgi:hypothetical protein
MRTLVSNDREERSFRQSLRSEKVQTIALEKARYHGDLSQHFQSRKSRLEARQKPVRVRILISIISAPKQHHDPVESHSTKWINAFEQAPRDINRLSAH